MKSTILPSGATLYDQEWNALHSDAVAASFLHTHQQLGALALGTNFTNLQTISFVINSTTITLTGKTGTLVNPGDFAIQATAALTTAVIWNALRNPTVTTSTFVGFNTTPTATNAVLLQYVGWALPTGGTTITPYSLNTSVYSPLTSFSVTPNTGNSWTAQTMQLYVEPGTYYINGTRYFFLGGSTPTVTAPIANPRIDVLTINTSGTLAWTTGTENASPVAPTYPANQLALVELTNIVAETALYDIVNQQSGQGYISNDVRPFVTQNQNPTAFASNLIPDTTDTRSLGSSSSSEWLNAYVKNLYVSTLAQLNGQNVAFAQFGGTGADGALSVTSGTTTINLGGASVFVKNYSSISITGGTLAFSNPNSNGTQIIFKCAGACTITSTASPAIQLNNTGSAASNAFGGWTIGFIGAGGTGSNGSGGNSGGGGAGGSSASTQGTAGSSGSVSGGASGASPLFNNPTGARFVKAAVTPGSGGGSGGSGNGGGNAGFAGGQGGGAFYLEVAGALNFTGTINATGNAGTNGTSTNSGGGAGGGGGGGSVVILYNTLTANSGTITVTGGAGGTVSGGSPAGGAGGAGATGYSLVAQNTEFV